MDKRSVIRGLFNYMVSVGLAVIFALYLNARVGWFLVAAFVAAPVVSVLLTLLFKRKVYITADTMPITITKGDTAQVDITVGNGMWLPSPPVFIDCTDTVGAECSGRMFSCSVMPLSDEGITIKYRAKICGPYDVGVEKAVIMDYFGLFSFRLKNADPAKLKVRMNVIPDVAEVPFTNSVFRTAAELSATSDDSEDTVSVTNSIAGGFPGYDNREYVPGDPLKRINWKQSAKRGTLLVRKDDEAAASSVSVVLDSVFDRNSAQVPLFHSSQKIIGSDTEELMQLAVQWAVEYSLGITRAFVMENHTVTYFYADKNGWQYVPVSDEGELVRLQTMLASFACRGGGFSRLPVD
ncbi:MAG: DUF58 domain-containing protein, partial [Oscillospiraceae bacterium]|nr:DUF58 domain-containing protein [Oscillospiraceae bacterium]